jgi:hypothetical protein
MSWLWIDGSDYCVRVELDENDRIKSMPPIFIKRFKPYFGRHKDEFIKQLKYVDRWRRYLIIKEME